MLTDESNQEQKWSNFRGQAGRQASMHKTGIHSLREQSNEIRGSALTTSTAYRVHTATSTILLLRRRASRWQEEPAMVRGMLEATINRTDESRSFRVHYPKTTKTRGKDT